MNALSVINAILIALSILVLLPIIGFCIECLAAVLFCRRQLLSPMMERQLTSASSKSGCQKTPESRPRAAVLIPAHNEQFLIRQTLDAILAPQSPTPCGDCASLSWNVSCTAAPGDDSATVAPSRVLVVADNCDDRTAELARHAGAEVVVRIDPDHRGKGYALQSGLRVLRRNPPDVVVVVDADCLASPEAIDAIVEVAWKTRRPVQALSLNDCEPPIGPIQTAALLGNYFSNMIRPLGLARLGVPCRLMGTGMAIPWRLADNVQPAGASLVEDMQMGIDLALEGHMPLFWPGARVTSGLPPARRAFVNQRTRWEHGHLRTAIAQIPPLLAAALRRRSWPLVGIALDLSIPPMTMLVALWLGAAILTGGAWWLGAARLPMDLLAGGGAALAATISLCWAVFCRPQVSLSAFAALPLYMFCKMPIYARFFFRQEYAWVRTAREAKESPDSSRPLA